MHGRSGGYDSMIDFFEKTKGSISLFLALIMLPMMTMAGLIVDGARISAAKASLSGAGDLAMNAALSEYDQILYDVYGIFAVSENMEELQNNVSRYFANSIDNTGILNDSDSYTREFINSIFSSFSGDEMEFNNIVDLKADRFTLQGVESSAIGNPKVLERQIVDYMKYRGPINIGKGLLTKLGCIGETSKQTKAIEAKVNYDQKLDTVQDACKKAYEAINEYNDLIGGNSKFASNEYLNQLSQDIDSAKKDVADMVKYLVAYNSSELNVPPLINERPSSLDSLKVIILKDQWAIFKVDSATRKEVESYHRHHHGRRSRCEGQREKNGGEVVSAASDGSPTGYEGDRHLYGVPPDRHQGPHCAGGHHLELRQCHPPGWRHLRLCKQCKGPVFCCRR